MLKSIFWKVEIINVSESLYPRKRVISIFPWKVCHRSWAWNRPSMTWQILSFISLSILKQLKKIFCFYTWIKSVFNISHKHKNMFCFKANRFNIDQDMRERIYHVMLDLFQAQDLWQTYYIQDDIGKKKPRCCICYYTTSEYGLWLEN